MQNGRKHPPILISSKEVNLQTRREDCQRSVTCRLSLVICHLSLITCPRTKEPGSEAQRQRRVSIDRCRMTNDQGQMTLARYHGDYDAAIARAIALYQQYSLPGSHLKLVIPNWEHQAASNN